MKIRMYWFVLPLAALILLPCPAPAQGTQIPPPPCCNRDSVLPGVPSAPPSLPVAVQPETVAAAGITITDSMVRALGLSRIEMLDRLRGVLLSGNDVDVLFDRTLYVNSDEVIAATGRGRAAGDNTAAAPVLNAEVKLHYRIPWPSLRPADAETLDHLFLSAGGVLIEVTFLKSTNPYEVR